MVALTYGSLNLTASPFGLEFGMDTGAPQNVYETLALLLQDGEVELSDRSSNRTVQFNVLIEGASLAALATSEAALIAETERALNIITIDPGDSGPVTVYETFRGQVTLVRDDDWETARLRRYTVTVKAAPFPRSAAEVTAAALAATGTTTTLVDDGSATTNWTGTTNGVSATVAVVSGAVGVTTVTLPGAVTIALTRTASITTSSTKYLKIDWKPASQLGSPAVRAYGDGTELTRVAQTGLPSGLTRTWFYVPAASIAVLRLDSATDLTRMQPDTAVRSFHVDNIDRTDVKPAIGTNRQLLRSIDVAGSARSPGSIAIEHASSALGDVLGYFFPDGTGGQAGYSPPMRQYRVAGGPTVTADTALVSGSKEDLTTGTSTFDIPYARLAAGSHVFMVRAQGAGASNNAATFNWTASTRVNATTVGSTTSGSFTVAALDRSAMNIFAIARIQLPTVDVNVASSTAAVRITLTATSAEGVTFDEGWLFNTTIGQLVQVACGTASPASGGAANRLWIEPATVGQPRPTVRIGFASDRSDAFYPTSFAAWQMPQFLPPRVNVFTVTTNALDASVTLRNYPRWHTHAAS